MSTALDAPRTGEAAAFATAADCKAWLKGVSLINAAEAHARLLATLIELNAVPIDAAERLEILETLRQSVVFVQSELAKRFVARALPLSPEEREAFAAAMALWDALAAGYDLCLEESVRTAAFPRTSLALAAARSVDTIARRVFDHHCAGVRLAPASYQALNGAFRRAEVLGVAEGKVPDALLVGGSGATSAARTWVRAALVDAANPRELGGRKVALVQRWLERWSLRVIIAAASPEAAAGDPAPRLHVNLADARGLSRVPASGADARALDMTEIERTLAKRIVGLRRGQSPAELGLGDDMPQPACEQLLVSLYRQWCESGPRRAHARSAANRPARVCAGLPAAHCLVSGAPFQPPAAAGATPHGSTLDSEAYLLSLGVNTEEWIVRDESVAGVGLLRPAGAIAGARFHHGQLLSLRHDDAAQVLLASVQWLQQDDSGALEIGARLLPGRAVACAAGHAARGEHGPALLLPAVDVLNAPAAIVVPPEQYGAGDLLEIYTDRRMTVRITALVERSADFERLAFEAADA